MLRNSGVAKSRNKRKNSYANEDENKSYLNNLVRGGGCSEIEPVSVQGALICREKYSEFPF